MRVLLGAVAALVLATPLAAHEVRPGYLEFRMATAQRDSGADARAVKPGGTR